MTNTAILAAARCVDGQGSLHGIEQLVGQLRQIGARVQGLTIDRLDSGWDTPLAAGHYRSGCAPLYALADAQQLLNRGLADAVLIQGNDQLRSDYPHPQQKALRQQLMHIYPHCDLPEAYTRLTQVWLTRHALSGAQFTRLRDALFENYWATWQALGHAQRPAQQWFQPLTSLFRGVDCANPNQDFSAQVLIGGAEWAQRLGFKAKVALSAVAVASTEQDGPAAITQIAQFSHLHAVYQQLHRTTRLHLAQLWQREQLALEAYTCYPVIPLALLLECEFSQLATLLDDLRLYPVTVTGGMNLARSAWNNPALNGLVALYERLVSGPQRYALLHGNGGLGYRQGLALLQRLTISALLG